MIHLRILVVALLAFSASPSSPGTSADEKPANQCAANPFSYDHGPTGQASWCGSCNNGALRQAPINIAATQESTQPGITFLNYNAPTNLVIYPNLPNLKVDYKNGTSAIGIGADRFKLLEFHFHRPSEEAIDNRRFPMVLHLGSAPGASQRADRLRRWRSRMRGRHRSPDQAGHAGAKHHGSLKYFVQQFPAADRRSRCPDQSGRTATRRF
jgi:Eukaryotic-type carbonic anhydrase